MHHHRSSIKNLLLAFCVTLAAFSAQAQWVSIPDTNFGKWLNTNGYNMCLQGNSNVGWQMDTTCNEVVSATVVDCDSSNLSSIEGVQFFINLRKLNCSSNRLSFLPNLPQLLDTLICYFNQLTFLPQLPHTLRYIQTSYNQLTALPALPINLEHLHCQQNNISSIPQLPNTLKTLNIGGNSLSVLPTLNDSLEELYCANNQISLMPTLPSLLKELSCDKNQLTSLPLLPNTLSKLYCGYNLLTAIPSLPVNLSVLYCPNNKITSLPTLGGALTGLVCSWNNITSLPPTLPNSLISLNCSYNQLVSIPSLPSTIQYLDCGGNVNISSLPALPSFLNSLNCYNTNLKCLPKLGVVRSLEFRGTGITCLPNMPQQNNFCQPSLDTIPICDAFNSNSCDVFYNISGMVFIDSNNNCVKDVSEKVSNNTKLLLYRNSVLVQQSITNSFGQYTFNTDLDVYRIRIDTVGLPVMVSCPSSLSHTSVITLQDSIDTDKDFGVYCKPGFDLGVHSAVRDSGILFPAQKAGIRIKAGDISQLFGLNCVSGVSGKVVVIYSGPVTYSGVRQGSLTPTITGNTLTYTIADFGAIDINTALGLIFLTDTFAQIGQQLCLSITVIPDVAGDINNTNNTLRICLPIVNSYDPNMKEVSPINTIAPDEDWLTYTIHFQNMGNAPAIHIYVMDTLDSNLDESSIQILGSSHRMLTEIKGKFARFNFPNINLIDSATNEPESKGWLQYKIKKKNNLALGTQIKNTASIYFDFNAPVVTNTVTNTVAEPSAVSYIGHPTSDIRLFPNPTNDVVYISYSPETVPAISLYNLNGAQINLPSFQNLEGLASISLSNLPAGVYFVSVEVEGSVVRKKVVKW